MKFFYFDVFGKFFVFCFLFLKKRMIGDIGNIFPFLRRRCVCLGRKVQ